tara:strand:- start:933 stop:1121 length:189 start_codon:yes stop_codon:yes gene_type:complete
MFGSAWGASREEIAMGKLTEIFGVSVVAVMAFIYSLSHIPGAVFSGLRYNSQTLGKLLGKGL